MIRKITIGQRTIEYELIRKNVKNINCGTKKGFCTIGKTICEYLSVNADISGESILSEILK